MRLVAGPLGIRPGTNTYDVRQLEPAPVRQYAYCQWATAGSAIES